MFEHPPFSPCPACGAMASVGRLSITRSTVTRRCRTCGNLTRADLPVLNKAVIYLDQFAVSNIHKAKAGQLRGSTAQTDFWRAAATAVDRVLLPQQAVFPASSVHRKETTVSAMADDLRLAHDMLSGGVSFLDADDVEMQQIVAFAEAYRNNRPPPSIETAVDRILEGERNAWLPDLHISANMSFAAFAPGLRTMRDASGSDLDALAQAWAAEKPTFEAVLARELASFGPVALNQFHRAVERLQRAENDPSTPPVKLVEARLSRDLSRFLQLKAFFVHAGVPSERAALAVNAFWHWTGMRDLPIHRICSYLFAAIARKMAAGKKRLPGRGALNDVTAIGAYGPYVDAMFIDNEFAAYLAEQPLRTDIRLKGPVFSINTGEAFIAYLDSLSSAASPEVKDHACEFYGVRA